MWHSLTGADVRERERSKGERAAAPTSIGDTDPNTLALYANQAIILHSPTKQGRLYLPAGVPIAFTDTAARTYFLRAEWAVATADPPEQVFEVEIDLDARLAATSERIMGA